MKNHLTFWKSLTTDSNILEIIQGYKIEFSMMPYQHNPRITPMPKNMTKLTLIQEEIDSLLQNTSNYSCLGNSKGIYFNNILSSKEIWRNETNNQFKAIEQLCGNNSFQNGNTSNSIKPTSEGRFSYQCGSEGCLLQHPSTSSSSQVSEIHLERTEVRVPVPTLWPQICPTNFHKMRKTNYVSSEVSRSSRHNLHRRFSMDGKDYSDNGRNR